MRRLGALVALIVVSAVVIDGARAATPAKGTVWLDDRTLHWQGEHYAAGSTIFAGMTCPLTTKESATGSTSLSTSIRARELPYLNPRTSEFTLGSP